MYTTRYIAISFCVLLNAALSSNALAAGCTSWPEGETNNLTTAQIVDCINNGVNPPRDWVPDPGTARTAGARGSGSGGFSRGTIAGPDMPPKRLGAAASTSNSMMDFANKLKSIFNSKDNKNGASGGSNSKTCAYPTNNSLQPLPSASWSCPANDAVANYVGVDGASTPCEDFGPVTSLQTSNSIPLACGGAIPLTNYRLTLADNPIGMVRTDKSNSSENYAYIYRNAGGNYQLQNGAAVKLPRFLCEWYRDKKGNRKKRKHSSPPYSLAPRSQMIMYNASTQTVALRLIAKPGETDSNPFDPADPDEYYLRLPVSGGVVYVPRDDINGIDNCDIQEEYYVKLSTLSSTGAFGDIMIESSQVPGCEADSETCAALGFSTSASASASCETATYYPLGNPAGVVCDRKIQYMVLNRPNLYFPPGSTAQAIPMEQVTSYMVSTSSGRSEPVTLVDKSENVMHLSRSQSKFTFINGAITSGTPIGLSKGHRLRMNGPVTFDMNALTMTMKNGGELNDVGGTPLKAYPADTVLQIAPSSLPVTVINIRDMTLPAYYAIPSQPAIYPVAGDTARKVMPYARQPLTPPQ